MWISSAEHGVRLIASTLLQRFLPCLKGTVHLRVFHQIAAEMSKGANNFKRKKRNYGFFILLLMEIFHLTMEQIVPGFTTSGTKLIAVECLVSLKDFLGRLNHLKYPSQII